MDRLSQPNQPITTEWSLHPEIVTRIFGTWGTPIVDMFATVHNTHLSQFMSPILEPQALPIDALSQDCQGRLMYMFPPFPLLSKVIQNLRTIQKGEVILIPPWWPSQLWFPHLLHLCVDQPLFFTYCWDLLSQQGYVSGMQRGSHAALPSSRIFKRSLEYPQQTECTTTGGFPSLTGRKTRN